MKRIHYYITGVVVLILVLVSSTWIGAVNGEVRKRNDVLESTGNVHAKLSGRYEKVGAFIDAIEDANANVLTFLETIEDARTAFANAISAKDIDTANSAATTLDLTFTNLLAYMEDNPESYSTVSLYSGYTAEFSASTNAVTYAITEYNKKVNAYNTHIEVFPNIIYVGNKTRLEVWNLSYYNASLPTFN